MQEKVDNQKSEPTDLHFYVAGVLRRRIEQLKQTPMQTWPELNPTTAKKRKQ